MKVETSAYDTPAMEPKWHFDNEQDTNSYM